MWIGAKNANRNFAWLQGFEGPGFLKLGEKRQKSRNLSSVFSHLSAWASVPLKSVGPVTEGEYYTPIACPEVTEAA